jgi:A/G-specific adenine glycosylase
MGGRINSRAVAADVAALRRALLRWYDRNRRHLPWRASRDPYRVWVAEVMLQQTRVAVVAPAYERFLRVFPSLERLAAASEDDVLSHWSGLGYYARARSLHAAARQLVAAGAGFPRDYSAARRLPGVGAYTAAAVLSIAYDQPHAAVDGNVVRVLSRLRRLDRPDGRGAPHAAIAAALLEARRPGDWNQAIMELGETICTPVKPRCLACPVAAHCEARLAGVADRHPPVKWRRATEKVEATMLVVRNRRGDVALERGAFVYLPKMWLPLLEVDPAAAAGDAIGEIRHAIAHRTFRIRVIARRARDREFSALLRSADAASERRGFSEHDLGRIGRSSLLRKALAFGGAVRIRPAPAISDRHSAISSTRMLRKRGR